MQLLPVLQGRRNHSMIWASMTISSDTIDADAMRPAADRASGLLKVLANPDRLLVLCQLVEGELCVGDIEGKTGIRQPTLSQQLTILREECLVATRRDGKQIFYRIASDKAVAVMRVLYQLYCVEESTIKENG